MTRPRLRVLGYPQVVLAAVALLSAGSGVTIGCSPKASGSVVGGGGSSVTGGSGGTSSTTTPTSTGGDILIGGTGGGGGAKPACDSGLGNVDDDGDGFSEEQGDCNDCDPNANPDAAEVIAEKDPNDPNAVLPDPADEDCDGDIDEIDIDLKPCDGSLALDSNDPMDAVKAIGYCHVTKDGKVKFLNKATWVLADGLPPGPAVDMTKYNLGHGLLDHFGKNDAPREGKRMLALSSGTARNNDEPGWVSRNYDKGYSSNPPLTFSGESPACPGVIVPKSSVQDAAAIELDLTAPSNALSLEFKFNFRTYEFPQFICTQYNDFFWANFVQGNTNKNISFDSMNNAISVNAAFLTQCDCPPAGPGTCTAPPYPAIGQPQKMFDCKGVDLLEGTDFDGSSNPPGPMYAGWTNAGSGWLITTTPVQPKQNVKIRFVVFDSGVQNGVKDHNVDSTVLIDAFKWHAIPAVNETQPE
ncbi:MAG: choice-of-anchor L domain-containing protein [Polyangiaceae bacterium]